MRKAKDGVPKAALRLMRLLNMAFIGATVLYAVVAALLLRSIGTLDAGAWGVPVSTERSLFVAFAVGAALAGYTGLVVLPRRQGGQEWKDKQAGLSSLELTQAIGRAYAYQLACVEVVALFGFILTVVTGKITYFAVGGSLTLLSLLRLYPKEDA